MYENYFLNKPEGFFLDIGAHDGVTGSNTFFFEKLGWDGICLEPIPSVFDKLKKNCAHIFLIFKYHNKLLFSNIINNMASL